MPVNSKLITYSVLNTNGKRKYLTSQERDAFLTAARQFREEILLFCEVMAATGCRISEALALTTSSFDFDSGSMVVECLKKRRKGVFREIPLPPNLLVNLKRAIEGGELRPESRIWSWSRMTAYRNVCAVMKSAGVHGDHASPKGLRHGFAVAAIQAGVPLNLVQRWLGHSDMSTTAIYASAFGPEERSIAARMWRRDDDFGRCGEAERHENCPVSGGENRWSDFAADDRSGGAEDITQPDITKHDDHNGNGSELDPSCPVIQFWLKCNSVFDLSAIDISALAKGAVDGQLSLVFREEPSDLEPRFPGRRKRETPREVPIGLAAGVAENP